jgi:osmotically-inducible protein OsmY
MSLRKSKLGLYPASIALSGFFLIPVAALPAQSPDNTANNKQHDVTADQQSNAASDRAITQKIRKALSADKSLSTYAHNVKIITANGAVTLKGPVKSDEERQQIASKAAEVVDASKIDNQLTVKAQ